MLPSEHTSESRFRIKGQLGNVSLESEHSIRISFLNKAAFNSFSVTGALNVASAKGLY